MMIFMGKPPETGDGDIVDNLVTIIAGFPADGNRFAVYSRQKEKPPSEKTDGGGCQAVRF
jgi:hypothetical protein